MYAEGSTTGAGGMGTMSPEPTAAPLPASQPQDGAAAAQLGAAQLGAAAAQPQPLLPQPLLQQLLWHENKRSRMHVWHLLQLLQPLLQPLSQPQADFAQVLQPLLQLLQHRLCPPNKPQPPHLLQLL